MNTALKNAVVGFAHAHMLFVGRCAADRHGNGGTHTIVDSGLATLKFCNNRFSLGVKRGYLIDVRFPIGIVRSSNGLLPLWNDRFDASGSPRYDPLVFDSDVWKHWFNVCDSEGRYCPIPSEEYPAWASKIRGEEMEFARESGEVVRAPVGCLEFSVDLSTIGKPRPWTDGILPGLKLHGA